MKYRATVPVLMMRGHLVGLTTEQAQRRRSLVRALPDRGGWFEVLSPFHFKAGETFETDREMSKGEQHLVDVCFPGANLPQSLTSQPVGALVERARKVRKG